jgi:excisionase family DNA binding protein
LGNGPAGGSGVRSGSQWTIRSDALLTVREAARFLRVSTATVYKLCARGELAHVRVLNVIRIPAKVVESGALES